MNTEDLEACFESAKEHGYKLISNNPTCLGFASELIFEKLAKSKKEEE